MRTLPSADCDSEDQLAWSKLESNGMLNALKDFAQELETSLKI